MRATQKLTEVESSNGDAQTVIYNMDTYTEPMIYYYYSQLMKYTYICVCRTCAHMVYY